MKSYNNKNIKDTKIINNFLKKFSYLGDKVFSNYTHGTSNKIDRFDYLKSSKLFNIFDFNIGNGVCGEKNIKIHEHNNEWLGYFNLPEGVCFDGKDFRDSTKKQSIIEEYKAVGWKFTHEENCELFFERIVLPIPDNTDIHAYFDTTSIGYFDAEAAVKALTAWHESIKVAYPSYTGEIYFIFLQNMRPPEVINHVERWLRAVEYSYRGTDSTNWTVPDPWGGLRKDPPNFGNMSLYTPPEDLIILSFSDECQLGELAPWNNEYHGQYFPTFGYPPPSDPLHYWRNPTQPTPGYNDDLSVFLAHKGYFNTLKQVLYPINKESATLNPLLKGTYKENVFQMVAAYEGKILTPAELSEIDSSVDLTLLLTENPYTVPLKDHGFLGVFDKTSPASDVFSSETFGEELTGLLKFNKPVYQYTSVKYPIKKLKPKEMEIDNKWNLTFVKNNHCLELTDSYLSNLYKISLK